MTQAGPAPLWLDCGALLSESGSGSGGCERYIAASKDYVTGVKSGADPGKKPGEELRGKQRKNAKDALNIYADECSKRTRQNLVLLLQMLQQFSLGPVQI